jgi:hypothetical protein
VAGVDVNGRVLAKMLGHHLTEPADLGVEAGQDLDLAGDNGGVGGLHCPTWSATSGPQTIVQTSSLEVARRRA